MANASAKGKWELPIGKVGYSHQLTNNSGQYSTYTTGSGLCIVIVQVGKHNIVKESTTHLICIVLDINISVSSSY